MTYRFMKSNDRYVKVIFLIILCYLILSKLMQPNRVIETRGTLFLEAETENSKLIIDWTGVFGNEITGWDVNTKNSCRPQNDCIFSRDKTRFLDADLLIFHVRDIHWIDIPPIKKLNQRYLFYLHESVMYTVNYHNYTGLKTKGKSFFNWTMTYRADSDFPNVITAAFKRKPVNNTVLDKVDKLIESKDKLLVWFASNCNTHSKRERYIKKLQQYVQVDIYGTCGPLNCSKYESSCFDRVHYEYKFYIAFENSICTDYMTEKPARTVDYWAVPIVLNRDLMYVYGWPQYSFIAVDDFSNVRELARYLKYLDGNSEAYRKYFIWRTSYEQTWETEKHQHGSWCDVCNRLHNPNETVKHYEDILEWWAPGGICDNEYVQSFL